MLKPRLFFTPIAAVIGALILYLAIAGIGKADEPPAVTTTVESTVQGKTAFQWHAVAARYRRQALRRWEPTVDYAYRLAAAVYGVPYWQLHAVGGCESHHYPFARNGQYLGIFQMHWRPFGFSPFDPVASALSAAQTVVHDGGWRQWECKP